MNIIAIIASVFLIVGVVFLLYNYFLNRHFNFGKIKSQQEIVFPLRLQAYERMSLFLERIKPENILTRISLEGLSKPELQSIIISEIKTELNHNVAQQIYVESETWDKIVIAANSTASELNNIIMGSSEKATSKELAMEILKNHNQNSTQLIAEALTSLKKDIQAYF